MFRAKLSAYTLIEILTVLVIVAVIATFSIGPIRAAQKRNRDAQRKTDINLIAQAIDLYYSENRTVPDDGVNCTYTSRQAPPWIPGLDKRYLPTSNGQVLPVDPLENRPTYFYTYTSYLCQKRLNPSLSLNGQTFKLQSILENQKDPDSVKNEQGKVVYEVVR